MIAVTAHHIAIVTGLLIAVTFLIAAVVFFLAGLMLGDYAGKNPKSDAGFWITTIAVLLVLAIIVCIVIALLQIIWPGG